MTKNISIYLAGKIQKAHEKADETYWSKEDLQQLEKFLSPYTVHFLNPAVRQDNLSDQHSVLGRDMIQVFSSDAVLVDARDRRGLGVGAEMMWAKMNRIPLISLSPMNSHYQKESTSLLGVQVKHWVHPFIEGLSDKVACSLEDAANWLIHLLQNPSTTIKDKEWVFDAMQYYLKEQFPIDQPMQDLAKACPELKTRFFSVEKDSLLKN